MSNNQRKISFRNKLYYKFDNMMSSGSAALIGWLGLISLSIVFIAATILLFSGIKPENKNESLTFFEAVWMSLMRALSSGNLGRDDGWPFRIVMLIVTLGGIFVVSTLIGILNNGIRKSLEKLRKGHSMVIENNHTLILGWSSKIFPIISELIIGNENIKNPKIVILADREKEKMEDELKIKIPNTKNTKIICRSGNLLDPDDIHIVNPQAAKSIILISPEFETSDMYVIKTILAITNDKNRKKGPYHIVTEIKDKNNLEVAEIVGNNEVTFVLSRDVISRIIVQTCLQSGLSIVYQELLDYKGSEVYFFTEDNLIGKTFKEILFAYSDSSVIGLYSKNGAVKLNPPMNSLYSKGDQIIVIAENAENIKLSDELPNMIDASLINQISNTSKEPENILILGWNRDASTIVTELNNYLMEGSKLTIVAKHPETEKQCSVLSEKVKNCSIIFRIGDITNRELLNSLNIREYHHIIVLCYSDILDTQKSDAITLITLLHLRDIASKENLNLSIVSEIMDIKNKKLAEITKADDFIVSDQLISLLMTQVSENKKLKEVFDDLFDADGSEIYLKPAINYVQTGKNVNFYSVVESAARRNEIAIGYRIIANAGNEEKYYGVVVNPKKTDEIIFKDEDKIIVVAEEE